MTPSRPAWRRCPCGACFLLTPRLRCPRDCAHCRELDRRLERGLDLPPHPGSPRRRALGLLRSGRLPLREGRVAAARVAAVCARCGWPPPRLREPEPAGRRTSREYREDGKEGRDADALALGRTAYRVAPVEA